MDTLDDQSSRGGSIPTPSLQSIRIARPLFPVEGQGSIPMSPLQFEIIKIPLSTAKKLNKLWHSSLPDYDTGFLATSMICFATIYKNYYFASAIWHNSSSPAFTNEPWLELRRMAISPEAPKNTASRMIKIMIQIIKKDFLWVTKLISYQDTSIHLGTIYKSSGWIAAECKNIQHELKTGQFRNQKTEKISYPKIRWEKQIRIKSEATIKPPGNYSMPTRMPKKSSQKGFFF